MKATTQPKFQNYIWCLRTAISRHQASITNDNQLHSWLSAERKLEITNSVLTVTEVMNFTAFQYSVHDIHTIMMISDAMLLQQAIMQKSLRTDTCPLFIRILWRSTRDSGLVRSLVHIRISSLVHVHPLTSYLNTGTCHHHRQLTFYSGL